MGKFHFESVFKNTKRLSLESNLQRSRSVSILVWSTCRLVCLLFVLSLQLTRPRHDSEHLRRPRILLFRHHKCTASLESTWTTAKRVLRQYLEAINEMVQYITDLLARFLDLMFVVNKLTE